MGLAVGWIGETEIRTQTAAPALDELAFPAMALYAMPAVTATLLEDSAVSIEMASAGGGASICRSGRSSLCQRGW